VKKSVYLSLGSNLGDRQANLRTAIGKLMNLGDVMTVSSIYETEPIGLREQPWFLNCVVLMQTERLPRLFLKYILGIEQEMGRKRLQPKGPRIIDIDILLFGNATIETPELTVPHPAMHERRFVLAPLAEIAPEVRHPVMKRAARELLEALPREGDRVKKWCPRAR
jgi:2-amino-4-hydroxy-6-hydroxymethyldihydropteridine diphosphokinase